MPPRPSWRTATLAATLIAAIGACSSAGSSIAPSASSSPAPSAIPSALASAVASAVASAISSQAANPSPLPMSVKSLDKSVKAGQRAGLTVATEDGAECSIVVTYATGPATDSGLAPSVAASNGYVQWGWTVPDGTPSGTVPVDVTCAKGTRTGQLHTEFTVK